MILKSINAINELNGCWVRSIIAIPIKIGISAIIVNIDINVVE